MGVVKNVVTLYPKTTVDKFKRPGKLTRITKKWFRLDVGDAPERLTFFAETEAAVRAKHTIYVRQLLHTLLPRPDRGVKVQEFMHE
jgi:hypothetical protein